MTEVSLRRAAQIINSMKADTSSDLLGRRRGRGSPVGDLSVVFPVDIDSTTDSHIEATRKKVLHNKDAALKLLGVETRIRQAVNTANVHAGVSALVTERVASLRAKAILEQLTKALDDEVYSKTDFEKKLAGHKERAKIGGAANVYGVERNFTVTVLTGADRDEIKQELLAMNRRLVEIDDKLANLNASHKVTINDDDWGILQTAGLV